MANVYIKNHPLSNLIGREIQNGAEEKFAISFNSFYSNNFSKVHGLHSEIRCETIREFPISNLGIADMISISGRSKLGNYYELDVNNSLSTFTLRAFEFKITDWKKGLMQAHRYTNYSHSAILVVSMEILNTASNAYSTFKELNVGLWGYDSEKEVLKKVFTPRPNKRYVEKYFSIAVRQADLFLTESETIS